MKIKTILLIVVCVTNLAGFAFSEDDFQYWTQYSFKIYGAEANPLLGLS